VLKNADREPRSDLLSGPGDLYDTYKYSRPMVSIRREPLVYSPSSASQPNHARLPDLSAMADMELAYREQAFAENDLIAFAHSRIGLVFGGTLAATAAFVLIGRFVPLSGVLALAPTAAIFHLAYLAITRTITARKALFALLLPPLVMLLAKASAVILLNRLGGSLLFALITLWFFWKWGKSPFAFYNQWLFAHPRLRPETRATCPEPTAPDWKLLAILLAIVVLVPWISTAAAIAAIIVLCVLKFKRTAPIREIADASTQVLAYFLTYGANSSHAPGVWVPEERVRSRWKRTWMLLAPFYLALAIGLTMFFTDNEVFLWGWKVDGLHGWWSLFTRWSMGARSPVAWMIAAATEIERDHYSYLWCYAVALAIGATLPPFMLLAVYAEPLLAARSLRRKVEGFTQRSGETVLGLDDDGRTEWQWYVDRMKDSGQRATEPLGERVLEADHLFAGVEPNARFPVLLHEKILSEHAYFVGDTGSGKTSLGIMPLLIQLIRGHRDQDGTQTPCPPIVVIDLKGDPALFHTVKIEAEARGAEFRFFTPEKGRASHYFNPFDSMASENRTDIQLTNLFLDALSLNHGEGYGRGFYSRQSRQLLYDALTSKDKPRSFKDLYEVVKKLRGVSDAYKDTLELVSTIHALQSYDMLAVKKKLKKPEDAIHMPSVLERRQVIYFWLPAAVESISVREIAKLALYSLLTAAIDRNRTKPKAEQRQAYVFIDEFQRLAGENFKVILEQARSFGLAAILANQSMNDLKTNDVDLRPTIRTNTRLKRYFSVTDPQDVKMLSESSGEEIMFLRSWTQIAGQAPYTEYTAQAYNMRSDSQSLKNRLTVNDILAVSDHPLDSIFHVSRGSGYTQFAGLPITIRCSWPIPLGVYQERQDAPWPSVEQYDEGEVIVSEKSPVDIEYERDREKAEQIHQALSELWANNA